MPEEVLEGLGAAPGLGRERLRFPGLAVLCTRGCQLGGARSAPAPPGGADGDKGSGQPLLTCSADLQDQLLTTKKSV